MNKISSIKNIFQKCLESAIYFLLFCFDLLPEAEPQQLAPFVSKYERRKHELTLAVRAFNLKKSGGAAK